MVLCNKRIFRRGVGRGFGGEGVRDYLTIERKFAILGAWSNPPHYSFQSTGVNNMKADQYSVVAEKPQKRERGQECPHPIVHRIYSDMRWKCGLCGAVGVVGRRRVV